LNRLLPNSAILPRGEAGTWQRITSPFHKTVICSCFLRLGPILAIETLEFVMKVRATLVCACLASTMIFTSAFAAPLSPGNPAGVKRAQIVNNTTVPLVIGAAIVATIAAVVSEQGQVTASGTTTTSTSP
jgi:hypothetical protein